MFRKRVFKIAMIGRPARFFEDVFQANGGGGIQSDVKTDGVEWGRLREVFTKTACVAGVAGGASGCGGVCAALAGVGIEQRETRRNGP